MTLTDEEIDQIYRTTQTRYECARVIEARVHEKLRKHEPVPKGFIVVSKDLLAEAIACNTDASLAEAGHIINLVLKVSDDEIFRGVLKEHRNDLASTFVWLLQD